MANPTEESFTCNHCGNISYMSILGIVRDIVSEGDSEYGYYDGGDTYRILKCPNCGKVNITSYFWHDSMDAEDEVAESVVYPQQREFPVGLPNNILSSLISAEKVKLIDSQSYALMLGRILELVCYDRKAVGETLYEMLEDLALKDEIPKKLVKVASRLRTFRNIGAHAGSGTINRSDLPIVRALLDAILAYVYSAQHLAELAELKLSKRKKTK